MFMWNSLASLLPTGLNFVIGALFVVLICLITLMLQLMRAILVYNGYSFFARPIRGTVAALALVVVVVPIVVVVVGEIGRQVGPYAKAALMHLEK